MHYMTKLEVEEFEDIKSGFRIRLFFDENPYFENQVLEKELRLGSTGGSSSINCKINWKAGSELAARVARRSKSGHHQRSFFSWLTESSANHDVDDIAEVIKDDMWPNPLQYFLVPDIEVENGVSGQKNRLDDDEDDDEDEYNDEDDEGDDDEDIEEAEEGVVIVEDDDDDEEILEGDEDVVDEEDFDDEDEGGEGDQ